MRTGTNAALLVPTLRHPRLRWVAILVSGWLTAAHSGASAEGFADLYAGWSTTRDSQVTLATTPSSGRSVSTSEHADYGRSTVAGIRIGRWSAQHPWLGTGLDLSSFGADGRDGQGQAVNADVIVLSWLLMARTSLLPSEEFPNGRLQPYLAVGPGLFHTKLSVDFSPALRQRISDSALDFGWDIRTGIAWQFRGVALFSEYRFTRVSPEYKETSGIPFFTSLETVRTMKTRLDTQQLIVGIRF